MILLKTLSTVFGIIPDSIVMLLAHLIHPFIYCAVKKEKWGLKVKKIIPKVFKDKDKSWQDRIIKKNTLNLMKLAGEMLKAHFKTDWGLNKKCYIRGGLEYFEHLLNSDNAFIIMTCHLGNWEYGAAYLVLKYGTIYAPVFVENSKGNRLLNWSREGHGVVLLKASRNPRTSVKTFFQMRDLLNRGEIIYLVADQAALGGDFKGNLFGKELEIFGGPFILGQKTHKPILPMYTLRDEKNRIALYFEEPFYINGNNIEQGIERVMMFFERIIGEYPEQYLWSQDRW